MATEGEYESILCVKPDVNVYRIPPRASNRGVRAADWKLDAPDWTGRMRVTARGKVAFIKLEDKISGELFAQAPVDEYPGIAIETVSDSSRYFVLRIQDESGRSAFIGIGFGDRGDSFDFNVALQDHFKWVKQELEISKQSQTPDSTPKLDLGFKEGQTITLNIGQGRKRDKSRPQSAGGFGLLPPPPGGGGAKIAPPPMSSSSNDNEGLFSGGDLFSAGSDSFSGGSDTFSGGNNTFSAGSDMFSGGSNTGCLLDLDSSNSSSVVQPIPNPTGGSDMWGDFSAPEKSVSSLANDDGSTNWQQF
ncbi:adaptin ear-binding coat-associated protein 1 [Salmo trutta]|uniref:Adaptin ear-binding coat-associated protein 1 n=1 Tax=Salmo trutta TaxID=8032 RepID=A0A673YTW2_SALTR|nr:adaptin ear-binding coat-associated protein 1-like [Salmo trutta]